MKIVSPSWPLGLKTVSETAGFVDCTLRTSWPVSIRATLLPFHRDYCGGGHVTSLAKEMDTSWGAPGKAFLPDKKSKL